jgi:site-specific DNA recombinase
MKCVLYARVSTEQQADRDLSIPAQLQAMREYCQRQGWSVVEEFIEPGVSAKTVDRPALQRLLAMTRDRDAGIGVVLVHKVDRLARNMADHVTIRTLLTQLGVRLASVVENVDESVSGQLVENIMASIAQYYSANLSEEVKKGMRQKVMNGGWPHRPPRGYVIVTTATHPEGVIEIHPKDGTLMKRAFELCAGGLYSVQALTKRLAKDGLLASTGVPIAHAHLRRLLSNSFYVGRVHWGTAEYAGTHPPLVSRELFDKVQDVLKQRATNPGPRGSAITGFPLRGLAICASCRGRMTCERHGRWRYYRCSRQTFRRELCSARLCNATRAHAAVENICRQIRLDRPLADRIAAAAQAAIQRRWEESKKRREHHDADRAALLGAEVNLTEAFARGDLAPNDYRARVEEFRARRKVLDGLELTQSSIAALSESVGRTLQIASSVSDLYSSFNELRKAALLKTVCGTIVLDHTGIAGFTLNAPFDAIATMTAASPEQLATQIVSALA